MSLSAAVIEALVGKGMSAQDILDIARASELKADPTNAQRQARFRAKKDNALHNGVTPAPNERDILTPTREEKPSPKGEVKKIERGVRLSTDWQPAPVTGKAAQMVACWKAGDLERELAKFKNYWLAKGANAARTDWQRTWVNWLISADERKPRIGNERPDPTLTALKRFQSLCGDVGSGAGTGEMSQARGSGIDGRGGPARMDRIGS